MYCTLHCIPDSKQISHAPQSPETTNHSFFPANNSFKNQKRERASLPRSPRAMVFLHFCYGFPRGKKKEQLRGKLSRGRKLRDGRIKIAKKLAGSREFQTAVVFEDRRKKFQYVTTIFSAGGNFSRTFHVLPCRSDKLPIPRGLASRFTVHEDGDRPPKDG